MEGWIKLYRKLEDHWVFKNPYYLRAWLWFLIRANHKKTDVVVGASVISLEKGQFITSLNKISEHTELTHQKTRTFLKLLEKHKMITRKSTNKLTIVTICKYDNYQDSQQAEQQTNNKQITNKQQTSNKQITTDKKEKNDKELKKNEKKDEEGRNAFTRPSMEDVLNFFIDFGLNGEAEEAAKKWYSEREITGWTWHNNKIADWKGLARKYAEAWLKNQEKRKKVPQKKEKDEHRSTDKPNKNPYEIGEQDYSTRF